MEALGNIGMATPQVLGALEHAWSEPGLDIRIAAADAIGKLGASAAILLPSLLARLDTSDRTVLEFQIEAIGKMGPPARSAVPILRMWCDPSRVKSLPLYPRSSFALTEMSRGRDGIEEPMPLPAGAALALVQIAPEQAGGFGKVMAEALTLDPATGDHLALYGASVSMDTLRRLRPLSPEIVPALESGLTNLSPAVRQLTAFQILCLDPDHRNARAVLLAAMEPRRSDLYARAHPGIVLPTFEMQKGDPSLRGQAAVYLWQLGGDTNHVLTVLRKTLDTVKDSASQAPLNHAAELGPAAKPLVPQIQALLSSEDQTIRHLAGKALRRIDPAALPPINEGYP